MLHFRYLFIKRGRFLCFLFSRVADFSARFSAKVLRANQKRALKITKRYACWEISTDSLSVGSEVFSVMHVRDFSEFVFIQKSCFSAPPCLEQRSAQWWKPTPTSRLIYDLSQAFLSHRQCAGVSLQPIDLTDQNMASAVNLESDKASEVSRKGPSVSLFSVYSHNVWFLVLETSYSLFVLSFKYLKKPHVRKLTDCTDCTDCLVICELLWPHVCTMLSFLLPWT